MRRPCVRPPRRHAPQRGSVLVEVLVSVPIFSVGVLALVGLQSSMTRVQPESNVRSDAATLACELIAMKWADPANVANYSSDACASNTSCNGWLDKVSMTLPDAEPAEEVNAATGLVTITLNWTVAGDSEATHKYTTATTVRSGDAT